MRNVAARVVAVCWLACALVPSGASATEPFAKVGTYGASWLQFPVGIRNIGMGATGTSDVTGFATGYFNPASVAWSNATTLTGSYENFNLAKLGLTLSEFQVTSPFPFHADSTGGDWSFTGGLAYTRQGMDDQTQRTIFLPEGTGRTFDADDWMLAALASSRWDHRAVSLGGGVAAKYINQALADDATIWVFDVGVIAAFPLPVRGGMIRPRLGYAALNLDSGGSYDGREFNVVTEQRVGFGLDLVAPRVMVFDRPVPSVSLSADYDAIDREHGAYQSPPQYSAGFEVSFVDLVHVRYGVLDHDIINFGAGVGWDYGHVLFRLDYAHTNPDDSFRGTSFIDLDRDTFGGLIGVRW
jgi:hypothetical protein